MIHARVWVELQLPHDRKLFAPLSKLGTYRYDYSLKAYVWTFSAEKLPLVSATLGRAIVVPDKALASLSQHRPQSKGRVQVGPKQGTGFVEVTLSPTKPGHFVVTTVREKAAQNLSVSFETVRAIWNVMKKYSKGTKILTSTVAKRYCDELGITGFNTYKDGGFNWKYFSGSRKHYLVFYCAIKVLAHYGVVEHVVQGQKSGLTRLKDEFVVQSVF